MTSPLDLPDFADTAPDLTCGVVADQGLLDLQNVREAIEAVWRTSPGDFPVSDLQCGYCGVMHEVPGRWFLVAEKLTRAPMVEPQVYYRCTNCGSIAVPDGFDQLAGVMEFFQMELPPGGQGTPLVKGILYDLGGLKGALLGTGAGPQ